MQTMHKTLAVIGLMLLAPAAGAHSFGAHSAGLAAGVLHPLLGLDHLLALIGVGLWAGWSRRGAHRHLPGAFLAGLGGGALLAWTGWNLPLVEPAIALSVFAFGALAASAVRPSLWLGSATVFAFALFHGFAHGTELPQAAQPTLYLLGLLTTSALVLFAALRLTTVLRSGRGVLLLRLAGGATAALGGAWLMD